MGRRTTNPMTRREAQKILAEPIRDGRESRLAASYLDLLDAWRDAYQDYNSENEAAAVALMDEVGWREDG